LALPLLSTLPAGHGRCDKPVEMDIRLRKLHFSAGELRVVFARFPFKLAY
jgi:hypothetical protein